MCHSNPKKTVAKSFKLKFLSIFVIHVITCFCFLFQKRKTSIDLFLRMVSGLKIKTLLWNNN